MTPADQREQALAAVQIIRAQVIDHGASLAASLDQQFAVVLAALTPPPLPADLAEIQARADAATPGPWAMTSQGGIEPANYSGPGEDFTSIAAVREDRDWAFIAHARTDVPALVAELTAARAKLQKIHDSVIEGLEGSEDDVYSNDYGVSSTWLLDVLGDADGSRGFSELAELRARPTLTPEQAHQLFIRLLGRTVEHEAWMALSAIARLHTAAPPRRTFGGGGVQS